MSDENRGKMDIREKGAPVEGEVQTLDRRLYLHLQVFGNCADPHPLVETLKVSGIEAVLYQRVSDSKGVALLTMHEDPRFFVNELADFVRRGRFGDLTIDPRMTMFGRTYSTGREPDLEDWMLRKARRTVRRTDLPWAVWYPLRRKGEFSRLSGEEQMSILREHGALGRAYAEMGFALDVRLACHGLDANDNDFIIGLIGSDLYPLSHLIQRMRKTRQTSQYIQQMGPFFTGFALYQSPIEDRPS